MMKKQYKYCDAVSQTKELLNSHRPAKPLAYRRNNISAYWRHMQTPIMAVSTMHKVSNMREFCITIQIKMHLFFCTANVIINVMCSTVCS